MSHLNKQDILNLFSCLRTLNVSANVFKQKLIQLKQNVDPKQFELIINGNVKNKIGSFEYFIVSDLNMWSLKSQILYEINVKKNNNFRPILRVLDYKDNLKHADI